MISNHAQFLAAIRDRKKVCVRFYSKPDSGVLDRVCAPVDYGPGTGIQDGLNRYWLWDFASETGEHSLGLMPKQILDLQVLGDVFDPGQFILGPSLGAVAKNDDLAPAATASSGGDKGPVL